MPTNCGDRASRRAGTSGSGTPPGFVAARYRAKGSPEDSRHSRPPRCSESSALRRRGPHWDRKSFPTRWRSSASRIWSWPSAGSEKITRERLQGRQLVLQGSIDGWPARRQLKVWWEDPWPRCASRGRSGKVPHPHVGAICGDGHGALPRRRVHEGVAPEVLKGSFLKYNPMTERTDYLWLNHLSTDMFQRSWATVSTRPCYMANLVMQEAGADGNSARRRRVARPWLTRRPRRGATRVHPVGADAAGA